MYLQQVITQKILLLQGFRTYIIYSYTDLTLMDNTHRKDTKIYVCVNIFTTTTSHWYLFT